MKPAPILPIVYGVLQIDKRQQKCLLRYQENDSEYWSLAKDIHRGRQQGIDGWVGRTCVQVHGRVGMAGSYMCTRDETIWRYIDTVSIRRLMIRIVAQRDISRYDLDICNQGKSPRCLYFFVFNRFFVFVQEI